MLHPYLRVHATARAVGHRRPTMWPGFELRSGHVGFVADKVALG
jgi:hypothetical protein